MLNNDFISQKAKESKIDTATISREYWQLLFLQRLYLTKGSERLFFKGGTAIRFLFGSFRFSEDLDFTSRAKKEEIESLFLTVFVFLKKLDPDLELRKEKVLAKLAEESLRYRFLFLPKGSKQKLSFRIDVSRREKPQTKEKSVLTPFDYPISPYPLVIHLSDKEILAEKIRALFVRGKPRDLFDLWFLLTKKVIPDDALIKKKFELYSELKFSYKELRKIVTNYDRKELKADLNQFLPENYREFFKVLPEKTIALLP